MSISGTYFLVVWSILIVLHFLRFVSFVGVGSLEGFGTICFVNFGGLGHTLVELFFCQLCCFLVVVVVCWFYYFSSFWYTFYTFLSFGGFLILWYHLFLVVKLF